MYRVSERLTGLRNISTPVINKTSDIRALVVSAFLQLVIFFQVDCLAERRVKYFQFDNRFSESNRCLRLVGFVNGASSEIVLSRAFAAKKSNPSRHHHPSESGI